MADFDDRITIEIASTNPYLRLWTAAWRVEGATGSTQPVPRHLLAEQLRSLVEQWLEAQDRRQDAAEGANSDETRVEPSDAEAQS